MNFASWQVWHFSLAFLATFGILNLVIYTIYTGIERFFFSDRKKRRISNLFTRILGRLIPVKVKTRVVNTSRKIFTAADAFLFSEDVIGEVETEEQVERLTSPLVATPNIVQPAVNTFKEQFRTLLRESESLVYAIDQDEQYLSNQDISRVDMIVDSLVFLEDQYAQLHFEATVNDVVIFKLNSMIQELRAIYHSISYNQQLVSNY